MTSFRGVRVGSWPRHQASICSASDCIVLATVRGCRAVGGDEVDPVHRVAGDSVRHAVDLGCGAAPRGRGRRARARRARGRPSPSAGRHARRTSARSALTWRRRQQATSANDRERRRHHGVVTETRTRPRSPFSVTRTKSERWPQIVPCACFERCPTHCARRTYATAIRARRARRRALPRAGTVRRAGSRRRAASTAGSTTPSPSSSRTRA